jgi:hypothetical protein
VLITVFLFFLLFIIGIVGADHYRDRNNFLHVVEKEQTLSLREKIRLWYDFLEKFPHSQYAKEAEKRMESARDTLFYRETQQAAREAKTPESALQKWQLYLNVYPHGKYVSEVKKEIENCQNQIPVPIEVQTTPAGALFLVDGQSKGKTPCIVSLIRSKKYILNFYLQGHQPAVLEFSITTILPQKLVIPLKPLQ